MALTITPPASPGDENNKNEKQNPKVGLTAPPKIGISVTPPKLNADTEIKKRDLTQEDDFLNREKRRKDLGLTEDARTYQSLGALSAEDAIHKDYDTTYKHLEEKVVEVKTWLQEYLSAQELNEKVALARKERGKLYVEMRDKLDRLLLQYFADNPAKSQSDTSKITAMVVNEILGVGPLEPLWQNKNITEIMVNGPYRTYVEIGGRIQVAKGVKFRDTEHLLEMCQQILGSIGKTLDVAHPYEDGRLPDGSRINATHPVIGPDGPYLTIRRFPETVFSVRRLIETGSMTGEMAEEIGNLVYHSCSTIVSGGTGSGKTSMLNALSGCIPDGVRIITIEDNLELRLHPDRHVIKMESRKIQQSGENKRGNVTIRDLVMNSLRQRPDRIIVGEVRDGTAYDMLQAMNTGHEGSMTTIHANDAYGAIERLSNLIAQVGELTSNQALTLISSGVDIIVSIKRFEDGSRRVDTISEIPTRVKADSSGIITLEPRIIWEFVQTGTTPEGMIVGEYQKQNDYSDEFERKHRLSKKRRLSLDELLELSDFDGKKPDAEKN